MKHYFDKEVVYLYKRLLTMKKLGRNDPCHCGSGKKYKNCHQSIDVHKESSHKGFVIGAIILVLVIIAAIALFINSKSASNGAPGPAPEGKVWSKEHGHWHDK